MNKILVIAVIIAISLVAGITTGLVIENSFNILGTSQKDEKSSIPSDYIKMVEDKHDKELVIKAYNFLINESKESMETIDYKIKPEIDKVEYKKEFAGSHMASLFAGDYYLITFRTLGILVNGKFQNDYIHNMFVIGIDAKTEKNIHIIPID